MVMYEFYFNDRCEEPNLIGILPERRKDRVRITRESIMKWGQLAAGGYVHPKSIYFNKIELQENYNSIFSTEEWPNH